MHGIIRKISAIYDRPDASTAHDRTFKDNLKQAEESINTDDSKISSMVDNVDKPFKCHYCQKSFKRQSKLIVHTRVHTGESKSYLF